jgi:Co/Zn/Cd efflux system component
MTWPIAEALKWDPTVSLGTVITIFSFVVTIIMAAWKMTFSINEAKRDVKDLKTDVSDMKPKVDQILVLHQQSQDHDRRMTRLEDAVFKKG